MDLTLETEHPPPGRAALDRRAVGCDLTAMSLLAVGA